MLDISADVDKAKELFGEMLEKYGVDEDKWREGLNELPKDQRQMVFTFDTGDIKDGFIAKFNFIFTAVELTIDEKTLKEIKEADME